MGSIVSLCSGKGGSGKTTATILLAVNLLQRGYEVAVIDADRNQSFGSWYTNAYEGPPLTVRSEVDHIRIVDLGSELAEEHDIVLVDTAGFENLTAASSIGMADHVVIPCMPDRGSVRETMRTAQQVASLAKAARRSIPYSILLTRWKTRGLSERVALESLRDEKLPVLEHTFADLAEYTKLSFSGTVPTDGKVGGQAAMVIEELVGKGAIPSSRTREKAA